MQISVECPQCGGNIVFDEEVEVVRCPYCGSTNQLSGKSDVLRFMLPPHWTISECGKRVMALLSKKRSPRLKRRRLQLVFAPYWRSKGMVFHWALGKRETVSKSAGGRSWEDSKELKTKAFDFSFPAYKNVDLGLRSLGIRTAALPLRLYHVSRLAENELVLPLEISLDEAIDHSNAFLNFGFSDQSLRAEVEYTQLVGEVYSIVYFPFWFLEVGDDRVSGLLIIDGVANSIRRTMWQQDLSSFIKNNTSAARAVDFGNLHLIPFRCPVCGWDLPFSSQSKTHVCTSCTRAWAEEKGSYRELDYQLAAVESGCEHQVYYMPFWDLKIQIHTSEGILRTRADLRTLLPAIKTGAERGNGSKLIQFLIPAFKINSMKSFSKLATLFCLSPPKKNLRAKERLEKERFEGVYLAGSEAEEMARVVLFSMVPRLHRRARKLLKDARIKSHLPRLIYYPFYRKGLYLREVNSNHGIQHGTVALNSAPL